MISNDEVVGKKGRSTCLLASCGALLLGLAVAAPVLAACGVMKPSGMESAAWVQRSASITAIFSLLVPVLSNFALRRLWKPGTFASLELIPTLNKYEPVFAAMNGISILFTLAGTLLWGYGDLIPESWLLRGRS